MIAEEPLTIDQIKARVTPDKVGYVLAWVPRRTEVRAFMTFLEYRHFTPDTPVNVEFDLFQVPFAEMTFFLVVVPKAKSGLAEQVMRELGLRAAGGVPLVIDAKGRHPTCQTSSRLRTWPVRRSSLSTWPGLRHELVKP
jgi:hypothetical protein